MRQIKIIGSCKDLRCINMAGGVVVKDAATGLVKRYEDNQGRVIGSPLSRLGWMNKGFILSEEYE